VRIPRYSNELEVGRVEKSPYQSLSVRASDYLGGAYVRVVLIQRGLDAVEEEAAKWLVLRAERVPELVALLGKALAEVDRRKGEGQ